MLPDCSTSGEVLAINISMAKGMPKSSIISAHLIADYGIDGDAHAGCSNVRQVSLLGVESIQKMTAKGLKLTPGDFAENITTKGFDLYFLKIGDCIRVGNALLEISQIGKTCHKRCKIYYQMGDCVMPREGVFAKVIAGGWVEKGDAIVYDQL